MNNPIATPATAGMPKQTPMNSAVRPRIVVAVPSAIIWPSSLSVGTGPGMRAVTSEVSSQLSRMTDPVTSVGATPRSDRDMGVLGRARGVDAELVGLVQEPANLLRELDHPGTLDHPRPRERDCHLADRATGAGREDDHPVAQCDRLAHVVGDAVSYT